MKLKNYLKELAGVPGVKRAGSYTGMGADGLSKQKLKTRIYKATKKFTHNKLFKDDYWEGPNSIWHVFSDLDLNWNFTKVEYCHEKGTVMPTRKEWHFEIKWENDKGKWKTLGGYLTAAGAGTVEQPLERYDLVLILY